MDALSVITFILIFIAFCAKIIFELGKGIGKQDALDQYGPIHTKPIIEDRPSEQSAFVAMHEGFVKDPPE